MLDFTIYFPCKNCDKSYIGETGRSLNKRIKEQRVDIRHQKSESGVAQHVFETGHQFDFNSSKIIFPSSDVVKRHIVESAVICHLSPNLCTNLNSGFAPHNKLLSKTVFSLTSMAKD